MEQTKKDHSIGTGTGAVAGAITGGTVGSVAGPVGTLIGAGIGAVVGAKAGDEVAEMVNPTEYTEYFERAYTERPYYNKNYAWNDYSPAYQYGYSSYNKYQGRTFDQVEDQLRTDWEITKGNSRMAWNDAREAVRDGWHVVERAVPGDFDRDGR